MFFPDYYYHYDTLKNCIAIMMLWHPYPPFRALSIVKRQQMVSSWKKWRSTNGGWTPHRTLSLQEGSIYTYTYIYMYIYMRVYLLKWLLSLRYFYHFGETITRDMIHIYIYIFIEYSWYMGWNHHPICFFFIAFTIHAAIRLEGPGRHWTQTSPAFIGRFGWNCDTPANGWLIKK